jgi:hypothetical protein
MPHDTLLMVFTGVLAVAVAIQTFLFFGIYKAIRQLTAYLDVLGNDLLRNVQIMSTKVDEGLTTIKSMAEGLKPIRDKLAVTTDVIHNRVTELDAFFAETANAFRQEVVRIQDTIKSASRKAEQTMDLLQKGLLIPLNEISAITRAVRVMVDVLFRRRRTPSGSTQDEEMFI